MLRLSRHKEAALAPADAVSNPCRLGVAPLLEELGQVPQLHPHEVRQRVFYLPCGARRHLLVVRTRYRICCACAPQSSQSVYRQAYRIDACDADESPVCKICSFIDKFCLL